MFKKTKLLSERFAACGGQSAESCLPKIPQTNKALLAKLSSRNQSWSCADNLHDDLLDTKEEEITRAPSEIGKDFTNLNVTLKVNSTGSSTSPCTSSAFNHEKDAITENLPVSQSLNKASTSVSDVVPKLSVLERGYSNVSSEMSYASQNERFNRSNTIGRGRGHGNRWSPRGKAGNTCWNSCEGRGQSQNDGDSNKIGYVNNPPKQGTFLANKRFPDWQANSPRKRRPSSVQHGSHMDRDDFQDEMDKLYDNRLQGQQHYSAPSLNSGFQGRDPRFNRKNQRTPPDSNSSHAICSNLQPAYKDSNNPCGVSPKAYHSVARSEQEEMQREIQTDNLRKSGSPRIYRPRGFYNDLLCGTDAMDSPNERKKSPSSTQNETNIKNEKDMLATSLIQQCRALVSSDQDRKALQQVLRILEKETGHPIDTKEVFEKCNPTRAKSTQNFDMRAPVTGSNRKQAPYEIPARFSPSVSSTSSPDHNTGVVLKFEGRTLLKGGVKPRHIPKTLIERPGIEPILDPRMKENYGKSSCFLALPKWHREFVKEQKDKLLKCIEKSASQNANNNSDKESDRNQTIALNDISDRNQTVVPSDDNNVVDMELDEDPGDMTNVNVATSETSQLNLMLMSVSHGTSSTGKQERSYSTAADMERSIMDFLKNVRGTESTGETPANNPWNIKDQEKMNQGSVYSDCSRDMHQAPSNIHNNETGIYPHASYPRQMNLDERCTKSTGELTKAPASDLWMSKNQEVQQRAVHTTCPKGEDQTLSDIHNSEIHLGIDLHASYLRQMNQDDRGTEITGELTEAPANSRWNIKNQKEVKHRPVHSECSKDMDLTSSNIHNDEMCIDPRTSYLRRMNQDDVELKVLTFKNSEADSSASEDNGFEESKSSHTSKMRDNYGRNRSDKLAKGYNKDFMEKKRYDNSRGDCLSSNVHFFEERRFNTPYNCQITSEEKFIKKSIRYDSPRSSILTDVNDFLESERHDRPQSRPVRDEERILEDKRRENSRNSYTRESYSSRTVNPFRNSERFDARIGREIHRVTYRPNRESSSPRRSRSRSSSRSSQSRAENYKRNKECVTRNNVRDRGTECSRMGRERSTGNIVIERRRDPAYKGNLSPCYYDYDRHSNKYPTRQQRY